MKCLQAIEQVLRDFGQPLHSLFITEQILKSGLWESDGKTPEKTVYAYLLRDTQKGDESLFIKVAPSTFSLRANELQQISPEDIDVNSFDPTNITDARERIAQMIANRRGQGAFRKDLLVAYGSRCAITGCTVDQSLEAAHIFAYLGPDTNTVTNGIVLRADVHTLFDLGLITINAQNMKVVVHEELRSSEYWAFHGRELLIPSNSELRPNKTALRMHFDNSRCRIR